jgi:hypothetical protein
MLHKLKNGAKKVPASNAFNASTTFGRRCQKRRSYELWSLVYYAVNKSGRSNGYQNNAPDQAEVKKWQLVINKRLFSDGGPWILVAAEMEPCHEDCGQEPAANRGLPRTEARRGPKPTTARCRPRTAACRDQPPATARYRPWPVARRGQMPDAGWHSPRPDARHSWSSTAASDLPQTVARRGRLPEAGDNSDD